MVSKQYIGLDPPVVDHSQEQTRWAPYWELEIEDGDHLRIDEQGYDNIHEEEHGK